MAHRYWENEDDLTTDDHEARRAYIQQTIAVAADDGRNLLVMATVAVGVVVFLIKDSATRIREVGGWLPELAGAAAVVLLIGAGLLYWYAAEVNLRRLLLARCLASNDALKARSLWAGPQHGIKKDWGWLLYTGMVCLGAGIVLSALVTWQLLTEKTPSPPGRPAATSSPPPAPRTLRTAGQPPTLPGLPTVMLSSRAGRQEIEPRQP
jgi:hypothetical protein